MPRPPFTLAGNLPLEHGLAAVRKELLAHPRNRHFAIIEFCLTGDHKSWTDDTAERTLVIQVMEADAVTITDDVTTLGEIRARARSTRVGQATLDDVGGQPTGNGSPAPPPEGGQPLTPEEVAVQAAKGQVAADDQARADELAARRKGAK